MNIRGKKVMLRAPEMRDAEMLNKWANDPEIWRLLGGWHFPYAAESTQRWIGALNSNNMCSQVFCVEDTEAGLIGTANLLEIDWKNRHASHGMMLGDRAFRGRGFGRDAVMALMRYAFDELGMERLDSGMVELNERSINFYTRSCGWEFEGKRKNWYFRNGRYYDLVMVGITRNRYYDFAKQTAYWSH